MDPYHTPHTAQRLKVSSHDILSSPLAPSHIHGLHTHRGADRIRSRVITNASKRAGRAYVLSRLSSLPSPAAAGMGPARRRWTTRSRRPGRHPWSLAAHAMHARCTAQRKRALSATRSKSISQGRAYGRSYDAVEGCVRQAHLRRDSVAPAVGQPDVDHRRRGGKPSS